MPDEERHHGLWSQVAVNTDNLSSLMREMERTRARLHKLEGGQAMLSQLPEMMREEILKAALRERAELRAISARRVQWLALGVALGGVLVAVVSVLLR